LEVRTVGEKTENRGYGGKEKGGREEGKKPFDGEEKRASDPGRKSRHLEIRKIMPQICIFYLQG